MPFNYNAFEKNWEGHIRELIQFSAKKKEAIGRKHRQIVEGACKVFIEKGFHPASIREIAEAAGMSMGQLYHYISCKDEVLFLIHRHSQLAWYKHLMENMTEDPNDPVKILVDAMRLTMEYETANKKLLQFIYSESKYLNKKHLQVVLQMDDRNVIQFWRDCLIAIQQKEGLDLDINFSANVLGYLMVFTPLRGWNMKDKPVREQHDLMIRFILKAIDLEHLIA